MIINLEKVCKELMYSDFEDKTILSFELDTQKIKNELKKINIQRIYNLKDNINFIIQVDNVSTFNSINLKEYEFNNLENYKGNLVYSCVLKICERQLDNESTFYYRVKIKQISQQYNILKDDVQGYYNFEFENNWSDFCEIKIKKNYTLDILLSMYNFIADYNAYNKEVKSANFYNFLLPHAKEFNKSFEEIIKTKEMNLLDKCNTNELDNVFGNNYGFNIPFNINTEEYRRMLINLRKAYLNAGTYNSINSVIKYFFGEDAEFKDYRNIYPWILRNKKRKLKDPNNPSYTNYKSNYYLYDKERKFDIQKNKIMLLKKDFKKFNFEIKFDNFFNINFIKSDIEKVINMLKPVYTKYILYIKEIEDFNPPPYVSPLLVQDQVILKGSDDSYIKYK